MTGKQLKNSILQWAIQGRLVPQDPNDEPASVLLEKIRAEKARLIKEGKIKKDKKESIIYRGEDNSYYEKFADGKVVCIDDEIPFEIPDSWQWERWGNLSYSIQYGYNAPAEDTGDIRMVRISDIQDGEVLWATVPFCHINKSEIDTYLLQKDDILFARTGGTVGKSFLVNDVPYPSIYAGYLIRTRYSNMLSAQYMKYFMECELYWEQLRNGTIATAQPNCNGKTLAKMLLPIPPYNEQIRITDKLNQVLEPVRKYGESQDRLDKFNIQIHDLLKKSVLQEAIQGRLVPQNASEEPASFLLQHIKDEKMRLVKEGKLKKKDVIDSTIFRGDDNKYYEQIGTDYKDISDSIPFDIPDNWCWVRGKTLFLPMESAKPSGCTFTYIDVDAVNNKKNIIDNPKILESLKAPSRATRKLHENDLLFSMVRPYLKNIALVSSAYANAIASTGFYVITPTCALMPQYLYYMMLSPYVVDGLNSYMKGENSPSINNVHIEDFLYPLPPRYEQQRIVTKIESLLGRLMG